MKRGTPSHPKVAKLAEEIHQPLYAAVGILEMLWHFTAEFSPRGDIGKYPDKYICAALKWGRSGINLISALVKCGFLEEHPEHRLIVHDWEEHADQGVRRRVERANAEFVTSHKLVRVKSMTGPARGTGTGTGKAGETSDDPIESEATIAARQIHSRHPKRRRDIGVEAVARHLRVIVNKLLPPERIGALHAIDKRHEGWCASEAWTKDGGEFAKGLDNWLAPTKGRYLAEPPQTATPTLFANDAPRWVAPEIPPDD